MRVIAGKWGGVRLISFHAPHIRPTTDRVKESLFNKLGSCVENSRVLDLFCGTGSLGIEALSRGARYCVFVDSHSESIEITRKNIEKVKAFKTQVEVRKADVVKFLRAYRGEPFNFILVDPPFTKKMAEEILLELQNRMEVDELGALLQKDGVVAIEAGTREILKDTYGTLRRIDFREYGDKALCLYSQGE